MIDKKFRDICAHENDDIYKAFWAHAKSQMPTIVVDDNECFVGMIGKKEWQKALLSSRQYSKVAEITNYKCSTLKADSDIYAAGRNVFAEQSFDYLPVVDNVGNLIDVFTRKRAFYKQMYFGGGLPRMHYANIVWAAVAEAKAYGYQKVSVIEFGVAGGNGLLNFQFHAREIGRLFNIDVEVYGFDTGKGIPVYDSTYDDGYKDQRANYRAGDFVMDYDMLKDRLAENTHLVLGDIAETGKTFFEKYRPAPIGAVSIDFDIYTSTLCALNMLKTDYNNVLPFLYMYWDDILKGSECVGENAALREFNLENKGVIEISPDGPAMREFGQVHGGPLQCWKWAPDYKICHYFRHPKYSPDATQGGGAAQLPLGVEAFLV